MTLPRWTYPWTGLEQTLRNLGQPLRLIGYGSLLNPASARVTLRSLRHPEPVLALGVRRVFDYPITDLATRRYGQPNAAMGHAVLNVHPGEAADTVGGVLLDVDESDIPPLRAREVDYDLLPVRYHRFGQPPQETAAAYILHRPAPPPHPLQPHRKYYQLCRDGAAALGEAFLAHYLDSTYLQDRRTTIRAWETLSDPAPSPQTPSPR